MILRKFFTLLLIGAVLDAILQYAVVSMNGTKDQCDRFFQYSSTAQQLLLIGYTNACLDKGSFPKYK